MGQNFCRNCSISLRFRDKHVFAFNAEIQDGRQKWRENDFCKKWPVDSADTLGGLQKWRENDFPEKLPVHSVDTLRVKFSSKLLYLAPFPR